MTRSVSIPAAGRLRRQITSTVVALSIAAGMVAATSTPAHAASFVVGCFLPATAATPAHSLENFPVQIHAWYNGLTYHVKTVWLGANHCASWDVPVHLRGYPLIMVLDHRFGDASYQAHWIGLSPWAEAGDGRYPLGINPAYCRTGCFMW